MDRRRARLLALAAAVPVLALAACGSASAPGRATSPASSRTSPAATASGHGANSASAASNSCGKPPPRHAWAADLSIGGQLRWQTTLPTQDTDDSFAATPPPVVMVGQVAVFAQDGAVYGLGLKDGRRLWSWSGGQDVYGIWRWRGGRKRDLRRERPPDRLRRYDRPASLDDQGGTRPPD
jgi:hypothetical protein